MRKTPLKAKTELKRKTPLRASKGSKRANGRKATKNAGESNSAPKKRKSRSLSTLKKKLDAVFSKYIRAKYPPYCYTCNKPSEPKNLQCGHFVSRQYLATRWEEDNCRPQCVGCNVWGHGQLLDFEENLKAELGEKRVEELKAARHQIIKLDRHWYEEQIAYYKNL